MLWLSDTQEKFTLRALSNPFNSMNILCICSANLQPAVNFRQIIVIFRGQLEFCTHLIAEFCGGSKIEDSG